MKSKMARVVVIGTSCVGKTTFARSLARVLSFPHVELDALYWQRTGSRGHPRSFARSQLRRSHKIAGLLTATMGLFVISFGHEPQL
jgi:adenylate kinase family enzyme